MKLNILRTKPLAALIIILVGITAGPASGQDVTIVDDFSFPSFIERDYGLTSADIQLSDPNPLEGTPITISADIHNNALCYANSAWGWYSSSGRSCWGEWSFNYPIDDTVDISFRCADGDATVHWRAELDGMHLASPYVPQTDSIQWKIVTIHDLPISAGLHTLFLGTYQMDYLPDYALDWVQIGDMRIEGEAYSNMGGNDPNPDLQGLTIWPRDILIQIWDGHPDSSGVLICEDFVGDTNTVIDRNHDHPGNTYEARYIANFDYGRLECEWTPMEGGVHHIYVIVDPDSTLNEIDELNNIACLSIQVAYPKDVIVPTYEWIDVYCTNPLFNGMPLNPGDTIRAYDPDGVLCGMDYVRPSGLYGFMPIYRDDSYSDRDEGAEPGDTISFTINDQGVSTDPVVVWTESGARFELCEFSDTICRQIHLREGWNLISWNVAYESQVEDLISEFSEYIDVIQSFDQGALTYDPDLAEYSTLEYLDYYHGYWFKMDSAYDLEICGAGIGKDEAVSIYEGWNLIGYWPKAVYTVEDALASILENVLVVLGFDEGGGSVWIPSLRDFNSLTEMEPLLGYWLKSAAEVSLSYPGFTPPASKGMSAMSESNWSAVLPSNKWVSVYGSEIMLDGEELKAGAIIEAYSKDGIRCGCSEYSSDILRFTPIYGRDDWNEITEKYPQEGESFSIYINGTRTYPDITWSQNGARIDISQRFGKPGKSSGNLPSEYALNQNFPNPFNPNTEISYAIPEGSLVKLEIFNIMGRKVIALVNEYQEAGNYVIAWNGRDEDGIHVSSGVYFYRITAGDFVKTRKMVLMK